MKRLRKTPVLIIICICKCFCTACRLIHVFNGFRELFVGEINALVVNAIIEMPLTGGQERLHNFPAKIILNNKRCHSTLAESGIVLCPL